MCEKKESELAAGAEAGTEYNSSNAKYIAYGAGYGSIPYFEGGVGTGSHIKVFEACGIKCELERHHKNTDFYILKKVKQEAPAPEVVTETESTKKLLTIADTMKRGFDELAAAATATTPESVKA